MDDIRAYRAVVLQNLERALIEFRCAATVADVQAIIYEREDGRGISEYIRELVALFNPPEADLDRVLSLIQDAWNYLPHRTLGNQSPAERLMEAKASKNGGSKISNLGKRSRANSR